MGGISQDIPGRGGLHTDRVSPLLCTPVPPRHHQHLHLLQPLWLRRPSGLLLRLLASARGSPVFYPGSDLRRGDHQLPGSRHPGNLPAYHPPAPPDLHLLLDGRPRDRAGAQTDQVLPVLLHRPPGLLAAPAHQSLHRLLLHHLGGRHLLMALSRALPHRDFYLNDGSALL